MPCNQTLTGIVKDCLPSKGGIVEVLLANYADVKAVTVADGQITAITMETGTSFKKYSFARNTGSLSSNYQINAENGSRYVQSDLVMVFNRMDTAKRIEVAALAANDLAAIVKDANGNYYFLGKDQAVNASAGAGLTGTAAADRNGYSVTLLDESEEMPYLLLVGAGGVDIDALLVPAA